MDPKFEPDGPEDQGNRPLSKRTLEECLASLYKAGDLSEAQLNCLADFSELFNPVGSPLDKPVGRAAFELSIGYMTDLEEDAITPMITTLVQAEVLSEVSESNVETSIVIPPRLLTESRQIVEAVLSLR